MGRRRDCLFGNAFHQTAVAGNNISVVRTDIFAVFGGDDAFGQSHTYGGGYSLSQRTGGHINPGQVSVLRVAGGFGPELAKILEVVEANILVAGQIKQRVKQH